MYLKDMTYRFSIGQITIKLKEQPSNSDILIKEDLQYLNQVKTQNQLCLIFQAIFCLK